MIDPVYYIILFCTFSVCQTSLIVFRYVQLYRFLILLFVPFFIVDFDFIIMVVSSFMY